MDDLFSGFDGEGLTSAETEQLSISKTPNNIKKSKRKVDATDKNNNATDSSSDNHDATKRSRASAPSPEPTVPVSGAASIKTETDVIEMEVVDVKTEGGQSKPRRPPAKIYPFELDGFQREAVGYLENDESVLVSAHTSAGKTAVAEYAIAMALRDGQRVVYTSPIKALSNQKYRDLHAEFSDVGLMTGDVTINPNASCLVMTTEILRSMLYRGSEILREVAWAIFDEVHYMRDKDRGVVWEESIILLPHKVKYVFLSATIPNGAQFCRWISKTHNQPCHIVYTEYRPTPLQHFVFPAGGEALYMVVDENTKFLEDKWSMAMSGLATSGNQIQDLVTVKDKKDAAKKRNAQKSTKLKDLERVIKLILEKKYDPVIVFSFSKKECELYATRLAKEDMTNPDEKALIKEIFVNAIDGLSDDDKELPSIKSLLPLLQHGVGIHHGGLLPILKEVTEILFGEGLLKVLVATETFAMGINMPAKTVVFTALRKFDGQDFRYVTAGEYIQMSGRAGRRGKDDRGIVILLADEKIEAPEAKDMMTGQADALSSTFHLGYNMLLNLFRVEEPEYMIRNSLHMFQREEVVPTLKAKYAEFDKEHDAIDLGEHVDAIRELYHLTGQVDKVRKQIREIVNKPAIALPFCQPGRLVQVKDDARDDHWGWGVVVGTARIKQAAAAPKDASSSAPAIEDATATVNVVHVLLPTSVSSAESSNPKPGNIDDNGVLPSDTTLKVVPCALATLDGFSSVRLVLPKDIRKQTQLAGVWRAVQEVKRRFKGTIPALDPVKDMKVVDSKLTNLLTDVHGLEKQVRECAANKLPSKTRDALFAKHVQRVGIRARQKVIEKEIRVTESLPMRDQLKRMKVVMRRLGLITKENAVDLKGRVACEIAACDELLATELVFGGAFNELTPEVTAALVSCLIYTERGDKEVRVRSELQGPLNTLQVAARRVAEIQKDAKIDIDVDEYVQSFRADLMEPIYQWCKGAKFGEVMQMTEIFEGTIVRCVRRQEELMRQLVGASRVIGDTALEAKFKAAIKLIHRDVAFAASLYL